MAKTAALEVSVGEEVPVRSSNPHRLAATALYCCVLFVQGNCVNILGPAGPTLTASLHASLESVGNVLSAEGAGGMVGASLIAYMLERHSGHAIICRAGLLLSAVLCSTLLCSGIAHVALAYFLVGVCLSLCSGVSNTLVSWVQSGRNVGPWVCMVNASFGLGSSSAPIFFLQIVRRTGNGMLAFASLGVIAALFALAAALLPSPKPPPAAEEALHASPLRMIGSAKGGSTLMGIDLGSRSTYVRVTVVVPFMLALTLGIGGEIAFGAWIYAYATERVGMASSDAGLLNALYWCTFTVGRLGTIPLAAMLTPELLLLPTIALESTVALLVLCRPDSAPLLFTATVGAGIGVCALYSNTLSLLASYDLLNPQAVSMLQLACGVGHMTIPNGVALVMRHSNLGHDALFYVLAVTNAMTLAIIAAVVAHLRQNFQPAKGSIREAQLAAKREL